MYQPGHGMLRHVVLFAFTENEQEPTRRPSASARAQKAVSAPSLAQLDVDSLVWARKRDHVRPSAECHKAAPIQTPSSDSSPV